MKLLDHLMESAPIAGLAGLAFAGSFEHIRHRAIDHGQTDWMSVGVAICIDLLC